MSEGNKMGLPVFQTDIKCITRENSSESLSLDNFFPFDAASSYVMFEVQWKFGRSFLVNYHAAFVDKGRRAEIICIRPSQSHITYMQEPEPALSWRSRNLSQKLLHR
jgi:hypothetical protein